MTVTVVTVGGMCWSLQEESKRWRLKFSGNNLGKTRFEFSGSLQDLYALEDEDSQADFYRMSLMYMALSLLENHLFEINQNWHGTQRRRCRHLINTYTKTPFFSKR